MAEETITISPNLRLIAVWTEEKTPQLKAIKVVQEIHGTGFVSANIDAIDLEETIQVLTRLKNDSDIQTKVKRRSER